MYTDSEDADMRSHLTFSQQEVPSLKPRRGRADRTKTGVPARRGVASPAGEDWNNGLGTEWKKADHSGRRKQNESDLKGQLV